MNRLKLGCGLLLFFYTFGENSLLTRKLLESLGFDITRALAQTQNDNIISLSSLGSNNTDGYEDAIVRL